MDLPHSNGLKLDESLGLLLVNTRLDYVDDVLSDRVRADPRAAGRADDYGSVNHSVHPFLDDADRMSLGTPDAPRDDLQTHLVPFSTVSHPVDRELGSDHGWKVDWEHDADLSAETGF